MLHQTRVLLIVAALPLAAWSCGNSQLSGKTAAGGAPSEAAESGGGQSAAAALPANPTAQQTALGHCLQAWGSNPFGAGAYTNFREIDAAVSVFGGTGYVVEDTTPTSQPALIVIDAGVSIFGNANYLLMNPNGWYCIMADVNVLAQAEMDIQCQSHLADSQVQVNVGSSGDPAAAVGVNVMSSVKVVRKTDANSAGGC